jgi:peptidoglycan/xylan/chitin deacetylase (PgdA/CDA1 family)
MSFLTRFTVTLFNVLLITVGGRSLGPYPPGGSHTELRMPILMYHYISTNPNWPSDPMRTRLSVPPRQFAAQLRYLQHAGYTTITLDDLAAALRGNAILPAKPIVLTFDDGYQDFYTNAYPILKQYGDQATIYIITGKVGAAGYMTWGELRELARSPLITIGAHTRTHPLLARLPPSRSWVELAGSKAALERQLGIKVRHLAYPYGNYSLTTVEQAQESGFETAVTTNEGVEQSLDKLLSLERVRVNGGAGLADLIVGLEGQRGAPRLVQIRLKAHQRIE